MSEALHVFDHSICEIHNKMVVFGADRVLAKHLDAMVTPPTNRKGFSSICRLFLLLYRCDDDHFQDSIAIVGSVLFPCLLAASYIPGAMQNSQQSIPQLAQRLCDINLDLRDLPWSHQLFGYFQDVVESEETLTDQYPLSMVLSWLVDGMLSRRENNKRFVMKHPTLVNAIIDKFAISFRPDCRLNLKVSQFCKLMAFATANRLVMMQRRSLLRLLFLLLHDEKIATRIAVLETLALLSLDRTGRTKLFNFLDHKLVDMSIKALQEETMASTALEFISVLVQHFSGKILVFSCPLLLEEVTAVAVWNKSYSLKAAKILRRLAETMSINAEGGSLLDCVLQLCGAMDQDVRYEGLRVLCRQCQSRPGCSFFVVHVPEAVSTLATLVTDPHEKVRSLSVELISVLAGTSLNVKVLAKNDRLLMALSSNMAIPDTQLREKVQTSAILALLHLIRYEHPAQKLTEQLCTFNIMCPPRDVPTLCSK